MAIQSDYASGTVTIAANATAVTGSGTAWLTAGFAAGDLLFANGYIALIGSVESNTALTLAQPWRGGALTSAAYRLRYQGDGSRISAQARQLIELIGGSGNLEALGKIAAVADRLAYFTGAGQMASTGLTAFARSLLDDADGAAARETLGVTAALAAKLDTTGGTLSGDIFISKTVPGLELNYTTVGMWRVSTSGDNGLFFNNTPSGGQSALKVAFRPTGDIYSPLWGELSTALTGKLAKSGGTISGALTVTETLSVVKNLFIGDGAGFAAINNQGNIVGAVWSSWGASDAFSAISARIEARIASLISGSLAATGYTKLQNGLIIQWGSGAITNGNVAITFPITFPNAAYSVSATSSGPATDNTTLYAVTTDGLTVSGVNLRGRGTSGPSVFLAGVNYNYIAIGR